MIYTSSFHIKAKNTRPISVLNKLCQTSFNIVLIVYY